MSNTIEKLRLQLIITVTELSKLNFKARVDKSLQELIEIKDFINAREWGE